ncbi:hypothetical protein [Tolumonas lignilytica]|uniref:hypothetical protein n=1 Tax=Tolumonas lignilytica TaxID=1283284 RepID=UPI0004638F50|nr:hypothetical protein [Tolumonas lignilytica]
MIFISNNGVKVLDTNYWESDMAESGLLFLSWNDGAGRLLIPKCQENLLREMKSGKYVIITRGMYNNVDSLEIMFEDNSESPFVVFISMGQTDRLIPKSDKHGIFDFTILVENGEVAKFKAKYRRTKRLPCMTPMNF